MKNKSNGLFILILCLIFLFGSTILLLEIAKYPKDEETKINKEDVSRKLEDYDSKSSGMNGVNATYPNR